MKILSAEQTRLADAHTIEHEPISSIDLMERASTKFVEAFYHRHDPKNSIAVVCGTGNNGGDGLAISRILMSKGYKIQPYIMQPKEGGSQDFLSNLERFNNVGEVVYINNDDIPTFKEYKIIIDAIFGSGLTRVASGIYAEVIESINTSKAEVVAVDIPSGLFVDTITESDSIVKANTTISFQMPKLSFFMPKNHQYVGDWLTVDIGLDQAFIANLQTTYSTIDSAHTASILPSRNKFDHKGSYGHGQLIGGSFGKMGAMTLSAKGFLRSGAGLLTVTIPSSGVNIMQTSVAEAMIVDQLGERYITEFNILENVQTIGIGPGLGTNNETISAFASFLRKNKKHLVLDADALNIISENRELLSLLPKDSIITPHIKEFDRLVGNSENNWERIEKAKEFAKKWQCVIVLKGAHTVVINYDGSTIFNTTGNPGMATAGSGDVLLGIITSFRTQNLSALDAAVAGTYIHGLAGDIAAEKKSMTSLIANDIIDNLSDVFLQFSR